MIAIDLAIVAIPNKIKEIKRADLIIHLLGRPPGSIEPSVVT
jgi:hypothetical protein